MNGKKDIFSNKDVKIIEHWLLYTMEMLKGKEFQVMGEIVKKPHEHCYYSLKKKLAMPISTIRDCCDALESKKLINSDQEPTGRRRVFFELSDFGEKFLKLLSQSPPEALFERVVFCKVMRTRPRTSEREVLFIRDRNRMFYPDKWGIPADIFNPNKGDKYTRDTAIRRASEIGVQFDAGEEEIPLRRPSRSFTETGRPAMLHVWAGSLESGEPRPIYKPRWLTKRELTYGLNLPPIRASSLTFGLSNLGEKKYWRLSHLR